MNIYSNGTDMIPRDWLSLHIFYHSNRFELLKYSVLPLLAELQSKKLIQLFFFIHYGEGGRHIRLRVLPTDPTSKSFLKDKMVETIFYYIEKKPSKRDESYIDDGSLIADNSILEIDYTPELERYGGIYFMPSVEQFFFFSSSYVLDHIDDVISNGYTGSLTLSLKMNLLLIKYLRLDIDDCILLYDGIMFDWLKSGNFLVNDSLITNKAETLINKFDQSFKSQYEILHQLFETYFIQNSTADFDESENNWIKGVKWFKDEIENKIALIQTPNFQYINPVIFILKSLIHMNNNRLGLYNHDESFLAFVISSLLKAYKLR